MENFLSKYICASLDFGHKTYHHFTGMGTRDNQLDILLSSYAHSEMLINIICSKENPPILSARDCVFFVLL